MKATLALHRIAERKRAALDCVRNIVKGGEVVCIASGPSLTTEDLSLVRAWRDQGGGSVFVANTTFRAALWADLLFAIDSKWWALYEVEVAEDFQGEAYSMCDTLAANRLSMRHFYPYGNTGAGLVALAAEAGASRIVMLGYDCQHTNGQTHWHGAHPAPLGDAGSVHKWAGSFRVMARAHRKTPIVNASRATALTCFPRENLEQALDLRMEVAA
jgi:hypothetical protein